MDCCPPQLCYNQKMRLWSLHPQYLDAKGLLALWREGLLAKKVLEGATKGYKNHPQLLRFKSFKEPLSAINSYLYYVYLEAEKRGYCFDKSKLELRKLIKEAIPVTNGQVEYEFNHLCEKLKVRCVKHFEEYCKCKKKIALNPLFCLVSGGVESWEREKKPK